MAKIVNRGEQIVDTEFKDAVENTPDISNGYKPGIGAVKGSDRDKILFNNTRLVGGSVDIDSEYKKKHPNDNNHRWDYVISYDKKTLYVEIHHASTSEVKVILQKLEQLKAWLKNSASKLDGLDKHNPPYYWVTTSAGVHLSKSSKEYKRLALNKIVVTGHLKM